MVVLFTSWLAFSFTYYYAFYEEEASLRNIVFQQYKNMYGEFDIENEDAGFW